MTESFGDLFDLIQANGTKRQIALWDSMLEALRLRRDRQREVRALLVEDALFRKACAGDVRACLVWLKVHMPEVWGEDSPKMGKGMFEVADEIEKLLEKAVDVDRRKDYLGY